MAIHAILGATGNLGSAVLRTLLSSKELDLTINILVRSKAKLLGAFPQLKTAANVNIFEGPISNEAVLAACLRDASIIYACVATNHSARKVEVALTTAAQIIAALNQLRKAQGSEYKPPVLMFNRSLTLSKNVNLPIPDFVKHSLRWVIAMVYDDLERADMLYHVAEKDQLLTLITMDGPMLMDGEGTEATGYKLIQQGTSSWYLSYADFGRAAVELGQRRKEFEGKVVAITATGKVRATFGAELWIIILGLRYQLFPF